jgi:hypothetical protein
VSDVDAAENGAPIPGGPRGAPVLGEETLAAATFRRSAESVRALLAAGADPHLGRQSAVATATFFELPDMLDVLAGAAS